VTPDEIPDPQNLQICLTLNGSIMQTGTTAQQLFPVADLVAYLSNVATLEPGDMVFTGTPPGVGAARKPPVFLKGGDVLEVTIPPIGTLRNPVV
jgi:2-keto-4-pentenoate hydratase/2-oxohepta-3-ene-1,7-dioic acid hydratase in catechol pathway